MSARMPVGLCRRRLATTWLAFAGIAFIVLLIQDMRDVYGQREGEIWDWFFPAVVPVASLMISTLVGTAMAPEPTEAVSVFVYRLALVLSVIYLLIVLAMPLSSGSAVGRLSNMDSSDRILVPIHALVGLALGAFFASGQNTEEEARELNQGGDAPKR